jgi:uncharacterized flavoprotein (TIGR03862 family)
MAAETLVRAGVATTVYEKMPSVGRKLLMAGRGGLNLTHSEPLERFIARYGPAAERLAPYVEAFPPAALIAWAEGLGQPVFTGTSGRVFPKSLKASPLLRAWLARLSELGVEIRTRQAWQGWSEAGGLRFATPEGPAETQADGVILALGGASWPRLGSDGAWTEALAGSGAALAPFRPSNMGVCAGWTVLFAERFAGQPLKNIAASAEGRSARGDAVVTRYGLEGGVIYGLSAGLRDVMEARGETVLNVDLRPDASAGELTARLARARAGDSASNQLRKALRLSHVEIGLLREAHGLALPTGPGELARAIKAVPLRLTGVQGLERAISSAGGVRLDQVDADLMLNARPGVFLAGEMLDWEAPTGGYLLQASFATGRAAAEGLLKRLGRL